MPGDSFYKSKEWRALREKILKRDKGMCTVEGCGQRALIVDHIRPRPKGVEKLTKEDFPNNLRSLCRYHDNQAKELREKRRSDVFFVKGGDEKGWPRDPNHPWNCKAKEIKDV